MPVSWGIVDKELQHYLNFSFCFELFFKKFNVDFEFIQQSLNLAALYVVNILFFIYYGKLTKFDTTLKQFLPQCGLLLWCNNKSKDPFQF